MHWFWRLLIAFLLTVWPYMAINVLASHFPESDRDILVAAYGIIAFPSLLLAFRWVSRLVSSVPRDNSSLRPRGRWLRSPWWKWSFLFAAGVLNFLGEAGTIIARWQLLGRIAAVAASPGPAGFPTRMSSAARDLLASSGLQLLAKVLALVLNILGLYLFWRDWRIAKLPHGHCEACGYDLTGNTSGVCPECGQPVPAEHDGGQPRPAAR